MAKQQATATASANGHRRAVLYARVSSDDRGKDGRNLASQIEMGRKYAGERGYATVAELPEDDRGASGAAFDLPQLGAVMAMAERGEFDVLIVREIDRLSRNLAKQLIVEERLRRCGVSIEYVLGEYPDNPEGNLMKHVRASVAEFEREKINERMTRGRQNIVRRGYVMFHGDRPPYGYRLTDDYLSLVIYEPEARIVRMVFEWYSIGDKNGKRLSADAIAQRLSKMQVPTWRDVRGLSKQRDLGQWHKATVAQMLHNETYCGKWHYGRRRDEGRNYRRQELIAVNVPAIVSAETWQAAQAQFKANRVKPRHGVTHEYLINARTTCQCGYAAAAISGYRKGHWYSYYICNSSHRDHVRGYCGLPFYRADHVDALIWEWLKEWLSDPDSLQMKLEAYLAEQERVNAPVLAQLKVTDDLIANHRAQLGRLLDLYLSGKFDADVLEDRKIRLNETICKLEQQRGRLATALKQDLSHERITEISVFAKRLAKGVAKADQSFEARKRIIELLDVRALLAYEGEAKAIYPSFVLSPVGEKRLVLGNRLKAADA